MAVFHTISIFALPQVHAARQFTSLFLWIGTELRRAAQQLWKEAFGRSMPVADLGNSENGRFIQGEHRLR